MSHVVQIQAEVRDPVAVGAAATRLQLPVPVYGATKLFSSSKTGWAIRLPRWTYPVVCDVTGGKIEFNNFEGRWGDQAELNKFLQAYAIERTKLEARRKGYAVTECSIADGNVKVTVHVGENQ